MKNIPIRTMLFLSVGGFRFDDEIDCLATETKIIYKTPFKTVCK
jgi:hypothetical protein